MPLTSSLQLPTSTPFEYWFSIICAAHELYPPLQIPLLSEQAFKTFTACSNQCWLSEMQVLSKETELMNSRPNAGIADDNKRSHVAKS